MDSRKTLVVTETFHKMLWELYHSKQKVSLLFDEHGMTRAEGFITTYERNNNKSHIVLDSGETILINSIIAVNGTFLSDYSEC